MIQSQQGFSLAELSIVLVIMGLLAGGVMVGRDMIVSSKMNALATEQGILVSATKIFQDKYYSLPGDFKQAEGVWGTASGGCDWGARSGTQTCNGNGDGKVLTTTQVEMFAFWVHLNNAGLLDDSYSGVYTGTNVRFTAGTDVPNSQWTDKTGWIAYYVGNITGGANAIYYDGNYGHVLMLGDEGLDLTSNGVMSPSEQKKLDTKFDDGDPDSGDIRGAKGTFASSCITGTSYNVSNGEAGCAPIWITGF